LRPTSGVACLPMVSCASDARSVGSVALSPSRADGADLAQLRTTTFRTSPRASATRAKLRRIPPRHGCLRARPKSPCAMPATTCRRAYDHRMRDLVCEERDPGLLQHLGLPRSTGASWIRRGSRPVVSAELAADTGHARARATRLESNRQLSCGACRPPVRDPSGLPDPSASSRVLQVHDEMSGMS